MRNYTCRFNAQSLVGRLVAQANAVLDSYYLDNVKYRLSLHDIQVTLIHPFLPYLFLCIICCCCWIYICYYTYCLPVMGIRIQNRIRIRRIRMFLGLPDPDPLGRGEDPDPAPDKFLTQILAKS
jgi:hypothetical protein